MERLSIFVHRASDCLTDYESNGDGLIAYSLLNGLAERGHRIFAYITRAAINKKSPGLILIGNGKHIIPFNSLVSWEHCLRANRSFRELDAEHKFDLVWRMAPFGRDCPVVPESLGRPLVIGPLFYSWPSIAEHQARPRFGIGLTGMLGPVEKRGWLRALKKSSLITVAGELNRET